MKCLVVVECNVSNPAWIPEYLEKVTPLVKEFGGRYLTRSPRPELLEGDALPQFSLVAEFESSESAKRFYESEAYAPYKQARIAGSSSKMLLVPVENETV